MTERKEDSRAIFPSNLEQTRVCFREMESLVDPLTAPRAPCLLIDHREAISIPPLCGLLLLRLLLRLFLSYTYHRPHCLEATPRASPQGTACRFCLEAALTTQPVQTHQGEVLPAS